MSTATSPPNPRRSPLSLHTGMSTSSGDEQSLRHLQQETQATTCTTGTSFTLSEHCNCGASTVFCFDNPKHQSLDATGMSTTMSKTASTSLQDHRDVHTVDELHEQGHRPPCQSTATAESPQFSALSRPGTSRWTTTGVINLDQELHLRDLAGLLQFALWANVSA